MRFAVETHGCRLNQAETDALVAQLEAGGHQRVGIEDAELYLLNSCAITHAADADARAAIRRARRHNPDARLVITGCHANAEPEQLAAMPELAAVLGNAEKQDRALLDQLVEIARAPSEGPSLIAVERLTRRTRARTWSHPAAATPRRSRPLLKIQDGCDYQCSFCIVPRVRGRSRSVAPEQVVAQLHDQLRAGAPEVVLTGAHLGSWGRDLARGSTGPARSQGLADLLGQLLSEVPNARLRLGSVDPHEVDDELIALLGRGVDERGRGLCQHIHLPIQAGDDAVLRAMRRAHRVADLEQLVPRLRSAAPGIALGTDVIVGFPGESDEAFERTLALFEAQAIPFAHVFVWSPRSGVPAADLPDRVNPATASARSRALRDVVAASRDRFLTEQIGTQRSAVILRRRARRSGALLALTDNYVKLEVAGSDALLGRRVSITIDGRDEAGLSGRVN